MPNPNALEVQNLHGTFGKFKAVKSVTFTLIFLQTALLVGFGQLVLKVDYLREPLGTLLVAVGLGLGVASLGIVIGMVARGDDQVTPFSLIAMFIFSAWGGTWFRWKAPAAPSPSWAGRCRRPGR
jgi:hypothetical protein